MERRLEGHIGSHWSRREKVGVGEGCKATVGLRRSKMHWTSHLHP